MHSLEQEVKFLWDLENSESEDSQLLITKPKNYCHFFGLFWPTPNEGLTTNKSNNLLSKVLLFKEQAHGINTNEIDSQRPVPTFVGLVSKDEAEKVLEKDELWSEENKIAVLFFHGKDTHRLQFNLIIDAVEKGILDVANLSIKQLKNILMHEKCITSNLPAWDFVLDTVAVGNNSEIIPEHPLFQRKIPCSFESLSEYNTPYIYGMDPYYLHSYLMTVARDNYPHLAQCVADKFCKSVFKLNNIEISLGYENIDPDRPVLRRIPENKRSVSDTMRRVAFSYNRGAQHIVTSEHILQYQQAKKEGKQFNEIKNSKKIKLRNGEIKSNGYVFRDTQGFFLYKDPYKKWDQYKSQRKKKRNYSPRPS